MAPFRTCAAQDVRLFQVACEGGVHIRKTLVRHEIRDRTETRLSHSLEMSDVGADPAADIQYLVGAIRHQFENVRTNASVVVFPHFELVAHQPSHWLHVSAPGPA